MNYTFAQYQESADYIRSQIGGFAPKVAMILGSGLATWAILWKTPLPCLIRISPISRCPPPPASGDYFFLDFSVENKTDVPFDIDQIRLKLTDKKTAKATNSQMVELHPVFTLEQTKRFRYGYRNVIVIRKMTFPNDKQLTIEMTENQISGRTISLKVNYSDVLSADSFNPIFLK